MHLSIIALLTPPDTVLAQESFTREFQDALANILSVVSRLRVAQGTAQLTAIDLLERKRVFDNQNADTLTPESLDTAVRKDLTTTSLSSMAGATNTGRFVTDLFKEAFDRAEKDTTGAEHVFIIIGARTDLGKDSIASLPASSCRCRVHYIRFFVDQGRDDIERLLKNYKPLLYEPKNWPDFRDQFGKIYGQSQ
jgi:hypothetical protein